MVWDVQGLARTVETVEIVGNDTQSQTGLAINISILRSLVRSRPLMPIACRDLPLKVMEKVVTSWAEAKAREEFTLTGVLHSALTELIKVACEHDAVDMLQYIVATMLSIGMETSKAQAVLEGFNVDVLKTVDAYTASQAHQQQSNVKSRDKPPPTIATLPAGIALVIASCVRSYQQKKSSDTTYTFVQELRALASSNHHALEAHQAAFVSALPLLLRATDKREQIIDRLKECKEYYNSTPVGKSLTRAARSWTSRIFTAWSMVIGNIPPTKDIAFVSLLQGIAMQLQPLDCALESNIEIFARQLSVCAFPGPQNGGKKVFTTFTVASRIKTLVKRMLPHCVYLMPKLIFTTFMRAPNQGHNPGRAV